MATIVTTSYKNPGTVIANGQTTGNGWSNPNNILIVDEAVAESNPSAASDIIIGNYPFSVPTNAIVTGISFRIRAYRGAQVSPDPTITIYAVNNETGEDVFTPYTTPLTGLTPDIEWYDLGGPTYLFGETWTAEQINNLKIQLVANADIYVDAVPARVSYYVPDPSPIPDPVGENGDNCNSQVQALPFSLKLPFNAGDTVVYFNSFNLPNGQPIENTDLGDFGGAFAFTVEPGVAAGNGNSFMENFAAIKADVQDVENAVKFDVLFRGIDFVTPFGPKVENQSNHGATSEVILTNNGYYEDRWLKKCHIGVLVSAPITTQDEGVNVNTATEKFNFIGPNVQATQDGVDPTKVNITILSTSTITTPTKEDDGVGTTGLTQATTLTIPRTIVDANYLRVWISTEDNAITSVTDNGNAMTLIVSESNTPENMKVALYGITNPTVGTHDIVVTMGVSSYITAGFISFLDVDTTSPTDGVSSGAIGSSTAPSDTVTPTINNTVLQDVVGTKSNPTTFTQSDPWSVVSQQASSATRLGASSLRTVLIPGAITDTYTISPSGPWAMIIAGVRGVVETVSATVLTDNDTIEGDGTTGNEITLKKVYTDATLTGLGTAASPLSVVGGGSTGGSVVGSSLAVEQTVGGIPSLYNSALNVKASAITTSQSGSVLFTYQNNTLVRFERDAGTGLFVRTHGVSTTTSGGGDNYRGGIAYDETNNFVYVRGDNASFQRYDADDLTGYTALTGTFPGEDGVCTGGSNTVFGSYSATGPIYGIKRYTISGTVVTDAATLTGASFTDDIVGLGFDTTLSTLYVITSANIVQAYEYAADVLTFIDEKDYSVNALSTQIGDPTPSNVMNGLPYGIGFFNSNTIYLSYEFSTAWTEGGTGSDNSANSSILLKAFTRPEDAPTPSASTRVTFTAIAGEDIDGSTEPKAVFIGYQANQQVTQVATAAANPFSNTYDVLDYSSGISGHPQDANGRRFAWQLTPSHDMTINTLDMIGDGASGVHGVLTVKFDTDNTGEPSGSPFYTVVTPSHLFAINDNDTVFRFADSVQLQGGVTYWLDITYSMDSTYTPATSSPNQTTMLEYVTGAWTTVAFNSFDITLNFVPFSEQVYQSLTEPSGGGASSGIYGRSRFIGFTTDTVSKGDTVTIIHDGLVPGFTSLGSVEEGKLYLSSTTPGVVVPDSGTTIIGHQIDGTSLTIARNSSPYQ
jgi:hypothetical protein